MSPLLLLEQPQVQRNLLPGLFKQFNRSVWAETEFRHSLRFYGKVYFKNTLFLALWAGLHWCGQSEDMIWYSIVTNHKRLSNLSIISRTGNNGVFTAVRLTNGVAGAMQISNHEVNDGAAASIGTPLQYQGDFIGVFYPPCRRRCARCWCSWPTPGSRGSPSPEKKQTKNGNWKTFLQNGFELKEAGTSLSVDMTAALERSRVSFLGFSMYQPRLVLGLIIP